MKNQKGFTLIELLIAIAIVAVLAGVVLLNIIGFIGKGKDTTAKGNMDTLLINVTSYYGVNKDFNGMIGSGSAGDPGDSNYVKIKTKLGKSGYTLVDSTDISQTNTSAGNWCGCVDLKEPTEDYHYCVDATGNKIEGKGVCSGVCSAGICVEPTT